MTVSTYTAAFLQPDGSSLQSCVNAGKCRLHSVDNVGTVPAAVAAYLATQIFAPDLIINAGTAGGFKARGAAIGDIYVGTQTVNHDRRIPLSVGNRYAVPVKLSAMHMTMLQPI